MINGKEFFEENDLSVKNCIHAPDQKYYFVNNKYNFTYIHDVGSETGNFTKNDINEFLDKYNRRYDRLKNIIKTSNSITFLSVRHFCSIFNENYAKDQILKLYNFLFEINNNIKFLAINFHDKNEKYNTLEFVNLDVNRNLPMGQSKQLFTTALYEFVSKYFTLT